MDRNGVLLSRENADRMQQVRAEIGRRLRERYDAGAGPIPERLADLAKKIQRRTDEQVRRVLGYALRSTMR